MHLSLALLLAGLASAGACGRGHGATGPRWFFGTGGQATVSGTEATVGGTEHGGDGGILSGFLNATIYTISPETIAQLLDKIPFEEVLFHLDNLGDLCTDPGAADRLAWLLAPHIVSVLETVSREELTTERAVKLIIKFAITSILSHRDETVDEKMVDEAVDEVKRFLTELRVKSLNKALKHPQINRKTLCKRIHQQWHQNQDQTKTLTLANSAGYITSTLINIILPGHAAYALNKIPFGELISALSSLDSAELARDPESVEQLAAVLSPTVLHTLEAIAGEELTVVRGVQLIIRLVLQLVGPDAEGALAEATRTLGRLRGEGQQARAAALTRASVRFPM